MSAINAALVKELRDKSGAGMMDCKNALVEAQGDLDKASEILRKKGIAKATKKADRAANEGRIEAYIHPGSKLGVLVEVNCETDFVANTDDYARFCRDVAMQIAASAPRFVRREDVDQQTIDQEMEIYKEQARNQGKPENILEKIATGKLEKFYSEVCLLEQPFVKDDKQTVGKYAKDSGMTVKNFWHWVIGDKCES